MAGQTLGLTSGVGASTTVTGKDESLSDVVSFLNTTAQQALGTSTAAKIVSLDANGSINIASQTKGANSSVSVVGAGTTAGLAASLNLAGYVNSATTGQARSLDSVVANLKESFNGNATLQQAGLTAQVNTSTNSLEIKSSNGTQFSLDAWGTKGATTDSDLGFGDSGTAFTNANAVAPQSSSSVLDTQGAAAIGTSANGTSNTASISFQNMQFGNDDQSISISANSAAGVAQTPLTITLQNDSTAQTGANIDSAISAINTKLQQSNNATLRSITAVQETGADGKESINFISSLSSFSVSVSSSAGAAVGDGLNGGQAKTFTSAMNGASSSIAIDTQAGAEQAVTALGAAIPPGQRASHHRPWRKPVDLRHQSGHVPDHQLLGCGIGNSRYQRSPAGGQPLQSPDLVAGCHSCHGPGQLRASGGSQPSEGLILTTNPAEGTP